MFDDRGHKRTIRGAPRSVSSLLVALLEPSPAVAIGVKLGSPGRVIFRQRRSAGGRIINPRNDRAVGCFGKLRSRQ
jgi:lipopolysaccharide/colanic/teichoic acid biosynthesis glycosyltransferase